MIKENEFGFPSSIEISRIKPRDLRFETGPIVGEKIVSSLDYKWKKNKKKLY